jgi:putative ABC transport system ATP-binding protein
MRLLRELAVSQGRTLIVVTHDVRILPFADRILRLEQGRLCPWAGERAACEEPAGG